MLFWWTSDLNRLITPVHQAGYNRVNSVHLDVCWRSFRVMFSLNSTPWKEWSGWMSRYWRRRSGFMVSRERPVFNTEVQHRRGLYRIIYIPILDVRWRLMSSITLKPLCSRVIADWIERRGRVAGILESYSFDPVIISRSIYRLPWPSLFVASHSCSRQLPG
jgi:hypothetical protein